MCNLEQLAEGQETEAFAGSRFEIMRRPSLNYQPSTINFP